MSDKQPHRKREFSPESPKYRKREFSPESPKYRKRDFSPASPNTNVQDETKDDHKVDICKQYEYPEKLDWLGAWLFPFTWKSQLVAARKGQFNIFQVFPSNFNGDRGVSSLGSSADDWQCDMETRCIKKDNTAIATWAPIYSSLEQHSEAVALPLIDKLPSGQNKDLVIISTAEPCSGCFESDVLQKFCNGINQGTNKPNANSRYNSCIYLWSIPYHGEVHTKWDEELRTQHFEVKKCKDLPTTSNIYAKIYQQTIS